ncbi:MAG TPA: DUF6600 domain-containing protein [Pyrinomonadaceae bacterium]|nr:DUF6600 domain-containing protein [Pyrinomonadaceae bacterium]
MRYNKTSLPLALLLLLLPLLSATPNLFARNNATAVPVFDEEIDDDYEETARVVRISLLAGDVSLRRAGEKDWERAALNLPLVEGDRLATGAGARVEIQIDARNFVRLGEYATLDIVTLRDEGVALSLPEGTATLRLARFDNDREYFEIDAPRTTLAAEQKGSYRLDVAQNGNVRVTVRDGGRARLYSETSGFTLRDGRTAELVYNNSSAEDGDWDLSAARASDNWDSWVDERETYLAARLRYDRRDRYYDNNIWGAEELDVYGDWINTSEYGYVWRPHVTVINQYADWAPYRYGSWRWVSPYGWTWVGDEPWGWAPYHYGRWVYVNNYWCWVPRHAYYRNRSWWRPALVAFVSFGSSYNDNVCWYPLGYRHRDPRSNYWRRVRDRAREQQRIADLNRINPIYQRAVTTQPLREFGKGRRAHPATKEQALRAISTEPVRGALPVRPTRPDPLTVSEGNRGNTETPFPRKTDGRPVVRNPSDPTTTTAALLERKTGAAVRRPGVALDGELRRGRIYNNREPRKVEKGGDTTTRIGDSNNERGNGRILGTGGERGTGAVARPTRPVRVTDADSNGDNDNTGVPAMKRANRPGETETLRPRPNVGDGERKVKTERTDDNNNNAPQPDYRPVRPPREERTKPSERSAPEVYRPRPEVREDRKSQREDRPERRERSEPRQERSAPREERPSPPPQREERPSPPPQREERRPDPPREVNIPRPSPKGRPDEPR